MRKRMFVGALVALLAVALAGGLTASNMGFKLNYLLVATGQTVPETVVGGDGKSADGTNELALPDNPQAGFVTARDLQLDIGATAQNIQKLLRDNNSLQVYTGMGAVQNFGLVAGDGYRVKLSGAANVSYIVVGSHNPTLQHTLVATGNLVPETVIGGDGKSSDGTNTYNYPYHSVAATARDLQLEIGPAAQNVQKLLRDNNSLQVYTGMGAIQNFNLVPGTAYRVKLSGATNVSFIPNHY